MIRLSGHTLPQEGLEGRIIAAVETQQLLDDRSASGKKPQLAL